GCTFLSEELLDIDSFNDFHSHFDDDPLSGSTTYSANSLLEEFADELALISYPLDYDDNRACDIESDIREIEFLLYQGEDSDFKDSIDQSVLTNCDDLFVDPMAEMFIDEQPLDYSFPPRFDVYPDDFLEIESDANFDDDSFDSEGEKIKEAKLLIDQLDLPCDILSELKKNKKGQNRIKTGQKREAWRSREKLKAVTVDGARKTKENAKRRAINANTVKSYSSLKERKKKEGLEVQLLERSSGWAIAAVF
nr:hypothetical protein [Tanacetum cinerariifolium]